MNSQDTPAMASRRKVLRFVLVLSFIGSGFSFLSNLFQGVFYKQINAMIESDEFSFPDYFEDVLELWVQIPRINYLLCAVLFALSLVGAIKMWNLQRTGFHFYSVSQLLVIVVTLLLAGRQFIQEGDIMLTLLFIIFYYFSLRSLGVFAPNNDMKNEEQTSQEE